MAECFLPADLCEDLLCCVICYEPFTESRIPKALPCLHSLCRPCLKGCISLEKRRNHRRSQPQTKEPPTTFSCPLCKETIRIPNNGIDGFKDDFRIRKISEAVAKRRGSDAKSNGEGSDKKCDICRCFNKNNRAESYCLECMKLLCAECSDRHLKTLVSEDHTIVNSSYGSLQGTTSCEHHPSEEVRYCCRDCQKPMCMTCTFSDEHSDHDIVKLSEEMGHIREQIGSLLADCKGKVSDMRHYVEECDSLQSKVHTKEKSVCRAILSRTLQEICRTRARQAKMEEEVESACRERHTELQERRVKIQEDLEVLDEACHFADMLLQKGHDAQVASTHAALVKQLRDASSKETAKPLDEAAFTDLGKYEALIQPDGETSDDVKDDKIRSSIVAEMRGVMSEMQMLSTDREGTKCKLLRKIGCTGKTEAQFRFPSAVAFLPNGDLVVCDLHNQRVQIFSAEGKFKSQFKRDPFKPCGVTVAGGDIVVADAGRENSCLRVFSVNGTQKSVIGRQLFSYPFSVAVNSRDRFVVSDPGVNKIFIVTRDNKVERQIDTKTKFGLYLTVNSRDEILLSDWHNHCIKMFDTRGKLIRKIGTKGSANDQLLLPLGVTTDKKDNILVLDCRNTRVSMFDTSGSFIKHLIGPDENLQHSRAVILSRDHGKLVITRGDPCEKRQVPNEVLLYQV